ncbi:DNA-binding protein [Halospina sp. K52047b]|uniref:DNA-binding protein n=1 Tax=Halospina sp. K52047b TaxID=2614160 RepID=UPI00124ACD3F|nr:DNA-binding protein [Halospina sp. K52047b]KAA8979319.1 DNA-binding protein [Halospina sp. K52047b]
MTQTLFLAWQDQYSGPEAQPASRLWFPIGRLDIAENERDYRFRYTHGAEVARQKAGFEPLDSFPELKKDYHSAELFTLFRNRVPSPNRRDYADIVHRLGLDVDAGSYDILAVGGGRRQTDNLEVFPQIQKRVDGGFDCRFFLHGWRHVSESARAHINELQAGDSLRVAIELNNPATGIALQLQTADDYHMLGWAPRYLVHDLMNAVSEASNDLRAEVARVNPAPVPHNQRVLVQMSGHLPTNYSPMDSEEFIPLVG